MSLLRANEVRVTIITIDFGETLISSFRTADYGDGTKGRRPWEL